MVVIFLGGKKLFAVVKFGKYIYNVDNRRMVKYISVGNGFHCHKGVI